MATAQQNGYVYIYVTNEIVRFAHTFKNNKHANGQSGMDVWFDDLRACPEPVEWVSHRTRPFPPTSPDRGRWGSEAGQEITPLSSKALLKTPNDRMLQQNEWDEEFGIQQGTVSNQRTINGAPHIPMRRKNLFPSQRSRKFLDRILMNNPGR
jgi:hypothetical protein